jgi:hypothetical protein
MSRLSFGTTIYLNYRFSQTPQRLLNHLTNLKGRINEQYNDNAGLEIISSKLISHIVMLILGQREAIINLFVLSIEKQRRLYDELAEGFLRSGMVAEQIIAILKNQINLVDLRLSQLFNADYNIIYLEDYYKMENEHIVVNLIDDLLLCKRRLIIFDNNEYLKRGNSFRFVRELNKIVNNDQIFFKDFTSPLLQQLANRLEQAGLTVFSSNNEYQLIIEKDDTLYGIALFWASSNFSHDTLNQYRKMDLQNNNQKFNKILIWTMELLTSFDDTVNRIIFEVNHE